MAYTTQPLGRKVGSGVGSGLQATSATIPGVLPIPFPLPISILTPIPILLEEEEWEQEDNQEDKDPHTTYTQSLDLEDYMPDLTVHCCVIRFDRSRMRGVGLVGVVGGGGTCEFFLLSFLFTFHLSLLSVTLDLAKDFGRYEDVSYYWSRG